MTPSTAAAHGSHLTLIASAAEELGAAGPRAGNIMSEEEAA